MARPLIISDCDEVLLHMVVPFRDWLDSEHHIHFDLEKGTFFEAIRHKHDGTVVLGDRVWELVREFFDNAMDSQYPIDGAVEAIGRLSEKADIIVLTNLEHHRGDDRVRQLRNVGINLPVHTNQGPKGQRLAELIANHGADQVFFIDDLGNHHQSALEHAPDSWRLHMVGEPILAPSIEPARYAHARIDQWATAERWIEERLDGAAVPPAMTLMDEEESK